MVVCELSCNVQNILPCCPIEAIFVADNMVKYDLEFLNDKLMYSQIMMKLLAMKNVLTAQKATGDAGYGDQIRGKTDNI